MSQAIQPRRSKTTAIVKQTRNRVRNGVLNSLKRAIIPNRSQQQRLLKNNLIVGYVKKDASGMNVIEDGLEPQFDNDDTSSPLNSDEEMRSASRGSQSGGSPGGSSFHENDGHDISTVLWMESALRKGLFLLLAYVVGVVTGNAHLKRVGNIVYALGIAWLTCVTILVSSWWRRRTAVDGGDVSSDSFLLVWKSRVEWLSDLIDGSQPRALDAAEAISPAEGVSEGMAVRPDGLKISKETPNNLAAIKRQPPISTTSLDDLFIINVSNMSRIVANSHAIPFETDFFTGQLLVMIRTPDDEIPETPEQHASRKHFQGKQRTFEFQYQIKLKKIPSGPVFVAAELDVPIKMGMVQRAFVSAALSFVKKMNKGFHYSLEGSGGGAEDDKGEKPHMAFQLEASMDRLVSSGPGEDLPKLGEEIYEDPESIKSRKKGGMGHFRGWNLEDTYTMAIYSSYVDWLKWKCINLPGIRPFSITSVAGLQPVNIMLYVVRGKETMDEKTPHLRSDMDIISHLEISNSTKVMGNFAVSLLASQAETPAVEANSNPLEELQMIPATEGDELNSVSDDDEDMVEELGGGMYLRSGDPIVLRKATNLVDEDAGFVTNGGGFAVLQSHSASPTIVIEKAAPAFQKHATRSKSKLIRSGDTVLVKLVHNNEVLYLSTHRGFWLKWVSQMPKHNGHFCIITLGAEKSIGETNCKKLLCRSSSFDIQSTYVFMGGTFSLVHRRWSRYTVGISSDTSATFGGRILGLTKMFGMDADDPRHQVDANGDELAMTSSSHGKGKKHWMKPFRMCAIHAKESFTRRPSIESSSTPATFGISPPSLSVGEYDNINVSVERDVPERTYESVKLDVPAWVEIMDRRHRRRQRAYIVRCVTKTTTDKLRNDDDTSSLKDVLLEDSKHSEEDEESLAFTRLRTCPQLTPLMQLGRSFLMGANTLVPSPSSVQEQDGISERLADEMIDLQEDIEGESTDSNNCVSITPQWEESTQITDNCDAEEVTSALKDSMGNPIEDQAVDTEQDDMDDRNSPDNETIAIPSLPQSPSRVKKTLNNKKKKKGKDIFKLRRSSDDAATTNISAPKERKRSKVKKLPKKKKNKQKPIPEQLNQDDSYPRSVCAEEEYGPQSSDDVASQSTDLLKAGESPRFNYHSMPLDQRNPNFDSTPQSPESLGGQSGWSSDDDEGGVVEGDSSRAPDYINEDDSLLQPDCSLLQSDGSLLLPDSSLLDISVSPTKRKKKWIKHANGIGRVAKTVKYGTTVTGKQVVKQGKKVTQTTVDAGRFIIRKGINNGKNTRRREPRKILMPKTPERKGHKHRERKNSSIVNILINMNIPEGESGNQATLLAGQLSAADQGVCMVSNVLSQMTSLPLQPPDSSELKDLFSSQIASPSELDAWFLRGDAAELGVVLTKNDEEVVHGCVVARGLWESHWREEWCVICPKLISFYASLTKKPAFSLSFRNVVSTRRLDLADTKSPLPGLPLLVIETTWRCHYVAFERASSREHFQLMLNKGIFEDDNVTKDNQSDSDKEKWKANLWENFQASVDSSFTDGRRGKWAPISSNSKVKQRTILNGRRMTFDMEPFEWKSTIEEDDRGEDEIDDVERKMGLFVEKMLTQVLSFSLESVEKSTSEFSAFLDNTSQLRCFPLHQIDLMGSEAICMFINIYHCLLQHALLLTVDGPPNKRSVEHFMRCTCYEIGGDVFSLAELECCVIRGKMSRPVHPKSPFVDVVKESSSYQLYSLGKVDPRINFVLNNGATSSPASVHVMSPSTMEQQLHHSCLMSLQYEISVDQKRSTISLPKVCEVYQNDFGRGDGISCVLFCLQYLDEEMQEMILELISDETRGPYIKYQHSCDFFHSNLKLAELPPKSRPKSPITELG